MEDSDDIRGLIERQLEALQLEAAVVSRQIKKSRTYLHDYLVKRSPKTMPTETKLLLAPILQVRPSQLGVPTSEVRGHGRSIEGFQEDDVVDYRPGPDDPIPPSHIVMKRIANKALDQHPRKLTPGKVVAFNTRLIDPKEIEAGAVVWVQLAQRSDPLVHKGSVVRQFIPPNKLITNSSDENEIISLDDKDRDLVAVIMGTMVPYVVDDSNSLHTDPLPMRKADQQQLNRNR